MLCEYFKNEITKQDLATFQKKMNAVFRFQPA